MSDKQGKVKFINEKGEEVEYDILFTFNDENTGKSYIVYTDNISDESGNVPVRASAFYPSKGAQELVPITTKEEWETIESILKSLQEE